ncbi:MAG TPA: hypothetical protein PK024_10715 [Methanospirillum sp.]|uniref:hypothetical protein n=1 Tax=Methanospirillum sp. TaxID=45200 RepID=UPI002C18E6EF|nr:hypothetical protein [Methanospirillum sp.]HOJ97293.1 hypothetical protein [Methanospirillum sp.]
MESKYDIYKFFAEEEARMNRNPDHKSEKIREFIRKFGKDNDFEEVVEYALYEKFKSEYPDVDVSKNYFHTIASKAWNIRIDDKNNKWIQLNKQKPMKRKKRR